jgi:tetratricopeptide (TPR) repeat protein
VPGWLGEFTWQVETRAGESRAAEQALRTACELFEEMGERGWSSTLTAELGHVLCDLGEYDEAEDWARKSRELGEPDDIITQMLWRQVSARVHARRAELVEAEQMARQAVDYAERTDLLAASGLAHLDLAEVLEAAGRTDQAAVEVETALGLFEQKGDLPMAEQARARLQRLL